MDAALARHARLVAGLRRRLGAAGPTELIETHISSVLLAGDFAYKLKKPVNLGFVDFTTLERRARFCAEELRLNRRLAPGLYLDRLRLTGEIDLPRIGGDGELLDYALLLRRFPQEALLERVLARGELTLAHMEGLGHQLATFHAAAAATRDPALGGPEAIAAPMRDNFRALGGRAPAPPLDRLRRALEAALETLEDPLRRRLEEDRIREGHGDLHLGNIVLLDDQPTPFDGIEFDPALRWIDVMSDLGFALMDLDVRGAPTHAHRLLNSYLETAGDYAGLRVLPLYLGYRAMVRAKVAALRREQLRRDDPAREEASVALEAYLAAAERGLRPPGPRLIITHGPAGCGKSTAARWLSDQRGFIRLRSDVERKRLHGLAAYQCSRGEIYDPASTARTYARLAHLARETLAAGYPVVVDAAFLKQGDRAAFAELAAQLGCRFLILAPTAPPDLLAQRVEQRQRRGEDASEADLAVLGAQLARYREPLPREPVVRVDTGSEDWPARLADAVSNARVGEA